MSNPPVTVLKPAKSGKPFKDDAVSPQEVLERARLVLSPRNAWRKGGTTGTHKVTGVAQRCAIQAINDCDGVHRKSAEKILLIAWNELYPTHPATSIPSFNDAAKTTKTDVLAAFDRAIELAKET